MQTSIQKPVVPFGIFESLELRIGIVKSANLAEGTRSPCRQILVDIGPLGERTSIGQFALVAPEALVGRRVLLCCNFAPRRIGKYLSEVLLLGTPHPASPPDQNQALPIYGDDSAQAGDHAF